MLQFAAITPHPPQLIPSIGKKQLELFKKTISALDELAENLRKVQPHTIVLISPHGPMRYDKFIINLDESFKGNFFSYGAFDEPSFDFLNNAPLASALWDRFKKLHFPVEIIRESNLDYGSLVPLYYLTKNLERKPRIVPLTFTALDWRMHYEFGKVIGQILNSAEQSIAFIASGDLSHRINQESPAGFSPYGLKFDQTLMELLKKNEIEKILNLNPEFCNEASECGLRSIIVALGTLFWSNFTFKELSYQHPIGIGHLVGQWFITTK